MKPTFADWPCVGVMLYESISSTMIGPALPNFMIRAILNHRNGLMARIIRSRKSPTSPSTASEESDAHCAWAQSSKKDTCGEGRVRERGEKDSLASP